MQRDWCNKCGKKDLAAILEKPLRDELAAAKQEQYLDRCRGDNLLEEVTALRAAAKEYRDATIASADEWTAADGATRAKMVRRAQSAKTALDSLLPSECRVCRGTGRDPMSDNVNWLPCSGCKR